jgi:hypothetical protein
MQPIHSSIIAVALCAFIGFGLTSPEAKTGQTGAKPMDANVVEADNQAGRTRLRSSSKENLRSLKR